MFDVDSFVADCRGALGESEPRAAIREVLERAVADPKAVEAALPAERAELSLLYASAELTVIKVVWAPGMAVPPHDHLMWAAIGLYGGEEDNSFYRRTADGLVRSGGKEVATGDSLLLGDDTIHAVVNPRQHAYTGAIHVYGGDYLNQPRSIWDAETLEERPATGETMQRLFAEANEREAARR